MARRKNKHGPDLSYRTLYIGGGTPSRLHPEECLALFEMLAQVFPQRAWEEITYELNPEDLDIYPDYPRWLQACGVSRISLGTQTTSAQGLKVLERQTRPQQVLESVAKVRQAFKGSLSLDLIIGWPGQKVEMLTNDDLPFLSQALPDHLSIYMLNVEPGTKLERDRRQGKIELLDDDTSASIWETLLTYMEEAGFEHYEISNFCKKGHESLHNTLTWRGHDYLGIGTGAVSRMGITRWTNVANPDVYIKKTTEGRWPVASAEAIVPEVAWKECLLLSLRHHEGLRLSSFQQRFRDPLPQKFWHSLTLGQDQGDLSLENNVLKFTPQGWSRFDAWLSDWMLILDEAAVKAVGRGWGH